MREFLYSIPLALILSLSFVCAQDNIIELTNADVLAMVEKRLSSDAIITKIQTSRCHFDTFPTVIDELRYKGVPEEVLVAMVAAPVGRPTKQVEKERTNELNTESVTAIPKEKAAPGSAKVGPTSNTATGNTATGSTTVAAEEKTTIPADKLGQAEKTATASVTAAPVGQASAGSVTVAPAEKATIAPAPPTAKQSGETKSLAIPERANAESGLSANAEIPASDRPAPQPSSTNPVAPVPTERRVSEPTNPAPMEQPKQADTTPQALTNSDIIKLLRSGSPTTAIVATIKAARGNYDLSAKALFELQQAGADATVFLSMMEITQKSIDNKTAGPGTNEAVQNRKTEKKNN